MDKSRHQQRLPLSSYRRIPSAWAGTTRLDYRSWWSKIWFDWLYCQLPHRETLLVNLEVNRMKSRIQSALILLLVPLAVACGTNPASTQLDGATSANLIFVNTGLGPFLNPLWRATNALVPSVPKFLPAGVPSALLDVSATGLNGVSYTANVGTILNSSTYPSAHITAVLRTSYTPAFQNSMLTGVAPSFDLGAPAAQVYQCQQAATGTAWTFIRPEA
jgi:hypothetical protein